MKTPATTAFKLEKTMPRSVIQAVKQFMPKKTPDIGGMSIYLLKKIIHEVAKPLLHVYILSIEQSTYPDKFKDCTINPIYKNKGSKTNVANYRGITLGDTFGKCFEKIIQPQLMSYLMDNNIIFKQQYGFLKGRSRQF